MQGIAFDSDPFALAAGEALFLDSDGVTEAEDGKGGFFGRDRLLAALSGAGAAPDQVIPAVLLAVAGFAGGTEQTGLSGISCVIGHDGKEGASAWPDGKSPR